ncbi:MAG: glycosyltransferase family 2 protein [Lacibacter sp.]
MKTTELLFWISLVIIFYTFIGYGILLFILVRIKRIVKPAKAYDISYEPMVTLVIPCYNEADILEAKIENSKQLEYPADKLKIVFITDGSTDHSATVLSKYPDIELLHENRRAGKTAAENRAMRFIKTPVVIFSDANTTLNKEAVRNIIRHFADKKTGCVSGEKRVLVDEKDTASAAGEGIYWKYESTLKKWDSELYSAVGAAGELVAFKTDLYTDLPEDTILDDFMQSLLIATKGYKIVYEPEAFAAETASANVKEELKRKIRIAAGGWQSISRLGKHLSMFKLPVLYFQYFSHRLLRWTVTPFLLLFIFVLNIFLAVEGNLFYQLMMAGQVLFYSAALIGYVLEHRKLRFKPVFVPYYFVIMNYAVLAGLKKYLSGKQQATWDKAQRKI